MLRLRTAALVVLAAASLLAGCGGDTDPNGSGGGSSLAPADTKDFTHAEGLITVKVSVDGQEGRLIVDSGSPVVLLDPSTFSMQMSVDRAAEIVVDDKSKFSDVQVIAASNLASPDPQVPIHGLLGCDLICQTRASFDYREGTLVLGDAAAPTGVGNTVKLPFSFEGGQVVQGITLPRSRIVVKVMLEDTEHFMIVDTGASVVTLRSTVFDILVEDGRPTIAGPTLETTTGTSTSKLARSSTFTIGALTAKDVLVLGDAAFDTFLDNVAKEVGHDIDGSIGGSLLGRYHLVIDYPNNALELAPYDDAGFLTDLGHSLGFSVGVSGSDYVVASVTAGSDAAAKGIAPGDVLEAIDGTTLTSTTPTAILALANGPVGKTRRVEFGSAKSASVSGHTIDLQVFDRLAPIATP